MSHYSSGGELNFPGGFAVLMAVYSGDDADLFQVAVNSIFANSLLPSQVLIVIDGPLGIALEDAIAKMVELYPIIAFIRLEQNEGLASALNLGLKSIRFPWVVRADADDFNLSYRFTRLAEAILLKPTLDLIGSQILEVDENKKPIAYRFAPETQFEIIKMIRIRCPFNHMSVAFRLQAVIACGGYPKIHLKEDYALWSAMIANGASVANLQEVLVHATAGTSMYKRRGGLKYAMSEFAIQKQLIKCGLQSRYIAFFIGIARAIIFLIPSSFRARFYSKYLRIPFKKS